MKVYSLSKILELVEADPPPPLPPGYFVKFYQEMLQSSSWVGTPYWVKLVWIALLLSADADGIVRASEVGVAKMAEVTLEQALDALERFSQPDPYSKSKVLEGRRAVRVDGGFFVINIKRYRQLRTNKQIATAERQKRHRERHGVMGNASNAQRKISRERETLHEHPAFEESAVTETVEDPPPPRRGPVAAALSSASSKVPRSPEAPKSLAICYPRVRDRETLDGELEDPAPAGLATVHAIDERRPKKPTVDSLDGWECSPEVRASLVMMGVPADDIDERLASLRLGPIGGTRGVHRDKLDAYVLAQGKRWRVWGETDRAKPKLKYAFAPDFQPSKAHAVAGIKDGLTPDEVLALAERCRHKTFVQGWERDASQFYIELADAARRKRERGERERSHGDRERFENPGRDRQ